MAIEITPFKEDMVPCVKEFNQRLSQHGVDFQFFEHPISSWLPRTDRNNIYQEYFLAVEDSLVRGAYVLKHQDFFIDGKLTPIANYQLPLSEGIINKKYSTVGVQLIKTALKKQPLLFALGMGGFEQPLPKMLKALGWGMCLVPFYFKVNNPAKFLKNIAFLRKSESKRRLLDFMAISGFGWVSIKSLHFFLKNKNLQKRADKVEIFPSFSEWSDRLWNSCKEHYSLVAVRDSNVLNTLYPENNERFIRLKVEKNNRVIGWAVVLDTEMKNHKQFGDMRVGSIIDCLSMPEDASMVINSATGFLEKRGVDLIVSNQSHIDWCKGLEKAGFLKGPSNFAFAASKNLSQMINPFDEKTAKSHLNRGDGDGPINL